MDDESWLVTLWTGIGGFVGWLNARLEVDGLCRWGSGDGSYNNCVEGGSRSADEVESVLAAYADIVYPSSILTGLALGLMAGVLLVAWKRNQKK